VRVLSLDTATEACSVALLNGDEVIGRYAELGRTHAQQILGMVEAVLAEAQLSLSMLDGIAASVGPGAFTGVRISVAVAQGLAFGADLRVVPVSTLEALAYGVMRGAANRGAANRGAANRGAAHRAIACLDARMGEVYWGCFEAEPRRGLAATSGAQVGPPESVVLPVSGVHRGVGRGFAAYPQLAALAGITLGPEDSRTLPDARQFARLGALRLGVGEGLDPADLSPLYLRDKVALTEAERALK
jgi:tRNA threonylcarbamoyladenosine biosynthesis protein TsaB